MTSDTSKSAAGDQGGGAYGLEPDAPAPQKTTPRVPAAMPVRSAVGGRTPASIKNAAPACPNCGYSMVGLKADTCPECGKRLPSSLSVVRRAEAKVALRSEYKAAAITTALAWVVIGALVAVEGGPLAVLGYYVYCAAMVVTGFATFMLCSMLWIGFDQPLGITALRLAAIYAIVDAVLLGFAMIPGLGALTLLAWLLALGLYISLMSKWLELETTDAVAVAIATQFVRFGLGMVLVFLSR